VEKLAEEFGRIDHTTLLFRRFHLFTELLLRAGSRPEVPLVDPVRLLRAFLREFPCSVAEGARRVAAWQTRFDDAEFRALSAPMVVELHLRRIEHLFTPSPEFEEYQAWMELWARVRGVPDEDQP